MNDTFGRGLGIFSAPERAGKMISRATPQRNDLLPTTSNAPIPIASFADAGRAQKKGFAP